MKIVLSIFLALALVGCAVNQGTHPSATCYQPPLGAIMLGVEAHHRKLGEAGKGREWDLALYELEELEETFEELSRYNYEQLPAPAGPMSDAIIQPAIEAVEAALKQHNATAFKSTYRTLTNSCNGCHTAAGVAFIKVKASL